MGKVWSKTELRVSTFNESYQPGEEVSGTVALYWQSGARLRLQLEVIGEEYFALVGGESRRQRCLGYQTVLFEGEIEKGSYEFPFICELPRLLPSSFQQRTKDYFASISYHIRASIPHSNLLSEVDFTVTPSDCHPAAMIAEESYQLSCCCLASDFIRVSACLDQSSTEYIYVSVGIDTLGSSQRISSVQLAILHIIRLRLSSGTQKISSSVLVRHEIPKVLEAHTLYTEGNALQACLPLDSLASISTTQGVLVESALRLEVKVITAAHRELSLSLPITYTSKAPSQLYRPPLPAEWQPVVLPAVHLLQRGPLFSNI